MGSPHRYRTHTALPVCFLVLGLAGCADAADARVAEASAAATAFERALGEDDLAAACAALAPATRGEVEDSARSGCAEALRSQELPDGGSVRTVDVHGRQARAVLASDTLFLSRFPGGWKVVAAGCEPRPGRPYRCTVEGG